MVVKQIRDAEIVLVQLPPTAVNTAEGYTHYIPDHFDPPRENIGDFKHIMYEVVLLNRQEGSPRRRFVAQMGWVDCCLNQGRMASDDSTKQYSMK